MNTQNLKQPDIDDKLLEQIISVAYNDAGFFVKLRIKKLISKDEELNKLYLQYKNTADSIHKLGNEICPEKLIPKIESKSQKDTFLGRLYEIFYSRPLVYSSAFMIIVAALVFSSYFRQQEDFEGYSREEVELAEMQVKQSLAVIGNIFNETTHAVKEKIIKSKVIKPLGNSIQTVNNLLNKEK